MEIRSIEIDFDRNILKINGEAVTDKPIVVNLPGPEGWPLGKLFNAHLVTGNLEGCDKLKVSYQGAINNMP